MEQSIQKLISQQQTYEYIQTLKDTEKDGSTKKRLSLLIQNKSLLMIEFMRDDKKPSVG